MLKAQGIYTNYSNPAAPSYTNDFVVVTPAIGYANGFLVKDWAFPAPGVPGNSGVPDFPYLDIPDPAFDSTDGIDPATNSYRWIGTPQVTDEEGVWGQNSRNPQSLFGNHQIVRVITKDQSGNDVGTFYDPSYGMIYASLDDMETKAIAGYYRDITVQVGSTTYYAYAIRTNDHGGHLVEYTGVDRPYGGTY